MAFPTVSPSQTNGCGLDRLALNYLRLPVSSPDVDDADTTYVVEGGRFATAVYELRPVCVGKLQEHRTYSSSSRDATWAEVLGVHPSHYHHWSPGELYLNFHVPR